MIPAAAQAVPCAVCGGTRNEPLYRTRRRTGTAVGDVDVVVVQCADCGFAFNSPRLGIEEYRRYYSDTNLASGQVFRDNRPGSYYSRLFAERAAFLVPFLARRSSGLVLDVGCGGGGFLSALDLPSGWRKRGIEPSAKASASARENGLDVVQGFAEDLLPAEAGSVDVLSLISVVEHLWAPADELAAMVSLLRPDGLLFIEVPNTLFPELSLTGFFSFEHVSHFTPHSLWRFLTRLGFAHVVFDPAPTRGIYLRCVAGRDPASFEGAEIMPPADDRDALRGAVARYAEDEARLLEGLERRVGAAFARWRAEGRKVAIYGAGLHTVHLDALYDIRANATLVLDGDPAKQGTTFLGLPVHGPQDIDRLGIDAVLISSQRFTDEIAATVHRHSSRPVEVERCYD
ncbi:class I SAM-dependent methyltransferase [Magnetospirillum aberrantis]|uniref:Methyltransferase domain-containing protein n=1 Tax=Magnetospirillum aberrantis SpK TaxID=908842 RepID=A0A7C9QUX9_9PROT|nr:class I SAM-dependent methyltransferase [Magnetospirillum aberrantis]NFV81185.1 methyltransferase domain-containing protein [Magnetospirillum aberrantis SpK]